LTRVVASFEGRSGKEAGRMTSMANGATKPATPGAVAGAGLGAAGAARSEIETAHTASPEGVRSSDPSAVDERIPPGTMVADRYRIARVLGEGGMGVVYAAEHVLMRKEVALKVLHAEMCSMPEVVARFEREAIAAAHIEHPNVAGATDFGRLPDGSCYLVLELLRGTSLRDEIGKGPIPLARAAGILRGIAAGVAAAHAAGVVHRDLKPENVMLVERDGQADFVKVLDFGIAKLDPTVASAPQSAAKTLTRIGAIFGTPEYMAPEQAVGDAVDARADLYALGVVFLEMLTGKCPFQGNALSILRERILAVGPPDMSAVADPGARALIEKLLTRQADDRMATANELVSAAEAILSGALASASNIGASSPSIVTLAGVTSARPSSAAVTLSPSRESLAAIRGPRRGTIIAALAGGVALLLGIIGVSVLLRSGDTDRELDPAAVATGGMGPSSSVTPGPSTTPAPSAPVESASAPETPAPSASAASARATPRKPSPRPRPTSAPQKRNGPLINIPPPKDWFK
jgi:eukaryotic-like serine/threonine-protein kinase